MVTHSFVVTDTFRTNVTSVKDLFLMSSGQIAVGANNQNDCVFEVYNLNDGQLIWNLSRPDEFYGMTEVCLEGKSCLAISFRYVNLSIKTVEVI